MDASGEAGGGRSRKQGDGGGSVRGADREPRGAGGPWEPHTLNRGTRGANLGAVLGSKDPTPAH